MAAASIWRGRRWKTRTPASSAPRSFPVPSARCSKRSRAHGLDNIRLFTDDALKLLQAPARGAPRRRLSPLSRPLAEDPAPQAPLHLADDHGRTGRTIRPGGFFRFATDIEDYADWGLAHVLRQPGFAWEHGAPGSWHTPYPGWQPTRYEQKAREEGRAKLVFHLPARLARMGNVNRANRHHA